MRFCIENIIFLFLQSYALNVDLALQRHNIYIITIIIKNNE